MRRLRILLLTAPLLTACGDTFTVDNPTAIVGKDLEDPTLVDALENTAEAAVAMVYDSIILFGDLPSDGITYGSTRTSMIRIDRGAFDGFNENYEAVYNGLSAARWTATFATKEVSSLVSDPSTDARVGRSHFWDAIARITLADLFEEATFDGAAPIPPVDIYQDALEILDQAITILRAAGDARFEAAALGAKARAARSLYFETGEAAWFDEAVLYAGEALTVDPNFRVAVRYQLPGRGNLIYQELTAQVGHYTIGEAYAFRKDPVTGEIDPRTPHSELQARGNLGEPYYFQYKYADDNADIPVSRWQEAQLLRAEYRVLNGDLEGAIADINAVRGAAGLAAFASKDAAEIQAQLIYERATEFWLELRRWADNRYYNIVPERWSPTSKELGVDRRWPISQQERGANPNA